MMKILMLTTEAFGGRGGIAQYNRDVLEAISSYPGCDEIVVLPRIVAEPISVLPRKITWVTEGLGGKLAYVLASLKCGLLRRHNLIVCSHINLLPLAFLINVFNASPIVLFVYGIDVWRPTSSRLANYLSRRVDACVSISRFTLERMRLWSESKKREEFIVPNAIRLNDYFAASKPTSLIERYGLMNKKVLLTVGRLSADEQYKGVDEVMECLPAIIREMDNIVYLICGDGTDRVRLEEKTRTLGLEKHVIFTGYIQEEEKMDFYRLADAFVMPGRGEGFGFVFLEAMACGIPVVASKLDGSREAVRDGTLGIMVDPDNRDELKSGIMVALSKERAVPEGLEYFSFTNFTERVHRIIDNICPP